MTQTPNPVMGFLGGLLVLFALGVVVASPIVLSLSLTKRWRFYRFVWLLVTLTTVFAGIFCSAHISFHSHEVSGPTAPFGDAPTQALWIFGVFSALVAVIYAFTKGIPSRAVSVMEQKDGTSHGSSRW
jgi:hypothetical protein